MGDHRNRGPEPDIHLLNGEYNLLCAEVDLGMKELGFRGKNNRGVENRDRTGERSKEKGEKLTRCCEREGDDGFEGIRYQDQWELAFDQTLRAVRVIAITVFRASYNLNCPL